MEPTWNLHGATLNLHEVRDATRHISGASFSLATHISPVWGARLARGKAMRLQMPDAIHLDHLTYHIAWPPYSNRDIEKVVSTHGASGQYSLQMI